MAAKIKKLTLKLMAILAPVAIIAFGISPSVANAQCTDNSPQCGGPSGNNSTSAPADTCQDTTGTNGAVNQSKVQECITQSPIVHDIQLVVDFLSAGVGIIVAAVIIVGGIQYSMAGDNPQAVGAAKKRITDGLIALIA